MGNQSDRQMELASMRFANEMQKYPQEVAVGVGIILPNLVNGCSWGFVNDTNEDFKKCIDAICKNPNMACFKVKNGYLVTMGMDYLLGILNRSATGLVRPRDLQLASEHRQKALVDLDKFMKKGLQGKIGIYNLNDSPSITVKGTTYRAFCVTLNDLLTIAIRNGYKLKLGGSARNPGQVASHAIQVISRLEVAPSGNALFIEVCR